MKLKKTGRKIWKGLTSPKSKATYKKSIQAMSKLGVGAADYFERTNRGLDRVVGTHDPTLSGQMMGVALPKGYKIQRVPKIIKGPRGYSVIEERHLVRIKSQKKKRGKKR